MPPRLSARRAPSLVLTLVLAFSPAARAGADDPNDEARALAVKLANTGAALFDARNAKGLALTYDADARLEIYTRDKDSGALKLEARFGRTDIEAYYQHLFEAGGAIHARNHVEYAQRIDDGLLMISGVFEPNSETAEPFLLPFVQTRARHGDEWRIISLQIFIIPRK